MVPPGTGADIRCEEAGNGVLVASIDMPGRSMNVFSLALMDALEGLLDRVERDASVRAVVLASGKDAFLAGADLDMIRMFTERARSDSFEALHRLCGRLGRLFRRLERSRKPFVAAVNGLALGGGLEVALACHARVLADRPQVQVGLPEIKLGLLPGAGGTQRLPRLIGTARGLRMLLGGEPVDATTALDWGMVDQVVPPDRLLEAAIAMAGGHGQPEAPWDRPAYRFEAAPFDFAGPGIRADIVRELGLEPRRLERYPAYGAIMDCVIEGARMPMDQACHWEMDCFVRLIQDPVAGNLVRTLFLDRQRAAKQQPRFLDARKTRVALVGGDGAALERRLQRARAQVVTLDELGPDDIALTMPGAHCAHGLTLAWQVLPAAESTARSGDAPAAVYFGESESGCALEIHLPTADARLRDAGLVLARWFGAAALVTGGSSAFLPQLAAARAAARAAGCPEDDQVLAVAIAAAHVWAQGGIPDPGIADVAAVLGGLMEACNGGPFKLLGHLGGQGLASGADKARQSAAPSGLFELPEGIDELLPRLVTGMGK